MQFKVYQSKNDRFQLEYKFGYLSKEGNRHFPCLWLAYGKNGFTFSVLGLITTVKFADKIEQDSNRKKS